MKFRRISREPLDFKAGFHTVDLSKSHRLLSRATGLGQRLPSAGIDGFEKLNGYVINPLV